MFENTVTVVDYDEPRDVFTVKTVTHKQLNGEMLNALVEQHRANPSLLFTAEERALIAIFNKHFDEVPQDMLNQPQNIVY